MMNRNATILMEHLCIIPHSSQFVRLIDGLMGGLLNAKSNFDPIKGTNKNFLCM